jgi:hypothetical protein
VNINEGQTKTENLRYPIAEVGTSNNISNSFIFSFGKDSKYTNHENFVNILDNQVKQLTLRSANSQIKNTEEINDSSSNKVYSPKQTTFNISNPFKLAQVNTDDSGSGRKSGSGSAVKEIKNNFNTNDNDNDDIVIQNHEPPVFFGEFAGESSGSKKPGFVEESGPAKISENTSKILNENEELEYHNIAALIIQNYIRAYPQTQSYPIDRKF